MIPFGDKVLSFLIQKLSLSCLFLSSHLGLWSIMVTFSLLMSAEWKVRFVICIASVAIQAITKLLFSFSDVLKTTNCTFQEVDNIFCLAVGIAVYDQFVSCMCAAEFLCALDVFARYTSSRITFLTLTIVSRSRGDVSSHQDVFQTFGFHEGQDGWFFEDFTQFWVFLYIYIYICRFISSHVDQRQVHVIYVH